MKKLYIALLILSIVGITVGYTGYQWVYGINTNHQEPQDLYIPTGSTYNKVLGIIEETGILDNNKSFDAVAKLMKYDRSGFECYP